jgi:hypothetical protein
MSEREKEGTLRFLRDQLHEIAGAVDEATRSKNNVGESATKQRTQGSGFKPPRIMKSNKSVEQLATSRAE